MLIKNGGRIMSGILGHLKFLMRTRGGPAAAFLGGFALLCVPQSPAQDLLLKEYIYLDGRLLAAERRFVTLPAQQTSKDPAMAAEPGFAYALSQNREPVFPGNIIRIPAPGVFDTRPDGAIRGALPKPSCPDGAQSHSIARENCPLRLDAYRWNWRVSGFLKHKNGGNDEDL